MTKTQLLKLKVFLADWNALIKLQSNGTVSYETLKNTDNDLISMFEYDFKNTFIMIEYSVLHNMYPKDNEQKIIHNCMIDDLKALKRGVKGL